MELSIIIINYNTFQLTCNCIASLQESLRKLSMRSSWLITHLLNVMLTCSKRNFPLSI